MNKSEAIRAIADRAGTTPAQAGAVLDAFFGTVAEIVGKGREKLTIPGWISFEQTKRAARRARNLRTGEIIKVPATKAVKITAGSKLKEAAKTGGKSVAAATAKKSTAKATAKKSAAKKSAAKKSTAKTAAKKTAAKKAPAKKAPAKKTAAKKSTAKRTAKKA